MGAGKHGSDEGIVFVPNSNEWKQKVRCARKLWILARVPHPLRAGTLTWMSIHSEGPTAESSEENANLHWVMKDA